MSIKITKDSLANVYLFYGEEAYKRRNYKEQLKKLVAGNGDINFSAFEGKDTDFSAVYDSVVTLPFFAEKRLVLVENSGKFKAKKKSDTEEDAESRQADGSDKLLEKILADLPATTVLAFFEPEVTKTKKIFKTIDEKGIVCECSADSEEAVMKWLARGFAAAGKNIKKSTAQLIIDRVGTEYDRLRQEYEKMVAFAGDASEITEETVLAVTSEDIESKIFDMLDSMCSRNPAGVLKFYYGLVTNREHPLYILAMVRMQFRTMLQVADLSEKGMSGYEIRSRLKKSGYVIDKHLKFARYFNAEKIEKILDRISETDRLIKSGGMDEQIGVELLLTEFSK